MRSAIAFSLHISNSRTKPAGLYFLYQRKLVDATLGFYIQDFICKEFKTYNLALFLRGISIKMPANVIIKKAPIVFPTSIQLQLLYYCLSQLFICPYSASKLSFTFPFLSSKRLLSPAASQTQIKTRALVSHQL